MHNKIGTTGERMRETGWDRQRDKKRVSDRESAENKYRYIWVNGNINGRGRNRERNNCF